MNTANVLGEDLLRDQIVHDWTFEFTQKFADIILNGFETMKPVVGAVRLRTVRSIPSG